MNKKFLSILLCLSLILSLFPGIASAAETGSFSDMPDKNYWSYAALRAAVENGLLQGSDGRLMPKEVLTRAQMAAVINRAFGAQTAADISRFADVSKSAWYYADIAKAVQMGTFMGGSDNTMKPDAEITRQEAFTVMARAFKLADGESSVLTGFADQSSIADYARGSVAALVKAGYIEGTNGMLMPTAPVTREQFAQIFYNMLSNYIHRAGIYTENINGNVMINTPDVTLKGLTVSGDVIIGEGVGNGDVTLDDVFIKGRLVVRGGGENSIHIINRSKVGSIIVGKTGDGGVRVRTEEGCNIDVVYVADGRDDITLEGSFNQIEITTHTQVTLNNAKVTGLAVSAKNADVTIKGSSNVSVAVIDEAAAGAELTVGAGAKVSKVDSAADNITIGGSGTVAHANISGGSAAVNTAGTLVTQDTASGGSTGNTNGSGNTSGGTTSDETELSVATEAAFRAALNNSGVQSIRITENITLAGANTSAELNVTKPIVVAAGKTLYVAAYNPGSGQGPEGFIKNAFNLQSGGSLTLEAGASLKANTLQGAHGANGWYHYRSEINICGGKLDASKGSITADVPGGKARIFYESGNLMLSENFAGEDVFIVYSVQDLTGLLAANNNANCDFIYLNGTSPVTLSSDLTITKILDIDIQAENALVIPSGVKVTIGQGSIVSVCQDSSLINSGTLILAASIANDGSITNNGVIITSNGAEITGSGSFTGNEPQTDTTP